MHIQKEIMQTLELPDNGKLGYVCKLSYNGKHYIFGAYQVPLKNKLRELYSMTNHYSNAYSDIVNLLKTVHINDINICMLEREIENELLDEKLLFYMNIHDESALMNDMNDMNGIRQSYATCDELKQLKNMMFATKKKK
jgi:hypothetical protein